MSMSNGKGENAEKMDSFEDPSNTSQTIVGEELIVKMLVRLKETKTIKDVSLPKKTEIKKIKKIYRRVRRSRSLL